GAGWPGGASRCDDGGERRCRANRRAAAGAPRARRKTAAWRRRQAPAPIRPAAVRTRTPAGSFDPARRSVRPAYRAGSTMSRSVRLSARREGRKAGSWHRLQHAGDRAPPAGVAFLALVRGHLWRKAAFGLPFFKQRLGLGIEAAREASNISGPHAVVSTEF